MEKCDNDYFYDNDNYIYKSILFDREKACFLLYILVTCFYTNIKKERFIIVIDFLKIRMIGDSYT